MKQIAWIYVVLVGLAVAFSAVSLAIYFMGPRPVLVSKKLKFGALIISFNTLLAGCYASKDAKESITCYGPSPDTNCDSANADTAAKGTDGLPVDTDVECYVSPPPDDTGTAVQTTDIDVVETDIECYDPVEETDIACYDTDEPSIETDTGEPPNETDIMCYELPVETDVECYVSPEDYPTDSETLIEDAGPGDTDPDGGTGN